MYSSTQVIEVLGTAKLSGTSLEVEEVGFVDTCGVLSVDMTDMCG